MNPYLVTKLIDLSVSLGGHEVSRKHIHDNVRDVVTVVESQPTLLSGRTRELAAFRTAKLAIVWAYFESRWFGWVVGDAGHTCGVLQTWKGHLGGSCADVIKNRKLGYAEGLRVWRELIVRCGSLSGALGAYASPGNVGCGGSQWLVRKRCKLAGGCG